MLGQPLQLRERERDPSPRALAQKEAPGGDKAQGQGEDTELM